MDLYTTESVAEVSGITMQLAQRWAKKNSVTRVGNYYFWTQEDIDSFHRRKKTPGPDRKEKE